MEKDNIFYKDGYRLGVKHGSISKLDKMIASDSFLNCDANYIQKVVIDSCMSVEEKFPIQFLDSKYEPQINDLKFYLLGYTDGKLKYRRNKADKKYHEKIGFKSKSYKLHEEVINSFADACKKNGTSLSSTLEKLMMSFVEEVNSKEKDE